jgi:hypothetical protein
MMIRQRGWQDYSILYRLRQHPDKATLLEKDVIVKWDSSSVRSTFVAADILYGRLARRPDLNTKVWLILRQYSEVILLIMSFNSLIS